MNSNEKSANAPTFDEAFRKSFRELVLWRRDVRRFRTDPVDRELLMSLLSLAGHAPSVGHAQPWRFVIVDNKEKRDKVKASFHRANADALKGYEGEKRTKYAQLKLEGLDRAPIHLAVFSNENPSEGAGLGRGTMPETLRYSVVGAINTLWLAARAEGLGLGWVSILEPEVIAKTLEAPSSWTFVAYLCMGWPEEDHDDPELVRHGWQDDLKFSDFVFTK